MEIATIGNVILEQSLPLPLWARCQGAQVGLYVQAFFFSEMCVVGTLRWKGSKRVFEPL